jgi:hypothetical protein
LELKVSIEGWPISTERITYSELEDVVKGVAMKLAREGFNQLRCRYRKTDQMEYLGTVWMRGVL